MQASDENKKLVSTENNELIPTENKDLTPGDGSKLPHVVIVGAGFGGMEAARALKNAPVRVTIIDRNNHHTFQPLLYQVATAGLSSSDITAPIRSIFHGQKNARVLMGEVIGVDAVNKRVILPDRAIAYDYVIFALGSSHSYFGHDEWAKYAPGLKTIADASEIRRRILLAFEAAEEETDEARRKALMTFVLVGAGPTGVELAGAISELAQRALNRDFRNIDTKMARILLIEAGPKVLGTFPAHLGEASKKALENMGVEVMLNKAVECIDADGVMVAGERIHAETVIWTAGVAAAPVGKWTGAETDKAGRVFVNPDLTIPNQPDLYVVGDGMSLEKQGKKLPGVAQVAIQSGRYAGREVRNKIEGKDPQKPFSYFDKGNLATVGRKFGVADLHLGKIKIGLAGLIGWLMWLGVHIVYLVGFRNRLQVLIQWAVSYLTYARGSRLIEQEGTASVLEEKLPDTDNRSEQREPVATG